jgi:hypothetical protein
MAQGMQGMGVPQTMQGMQYYPVMAAPQGVPQGMQYYPIPAPQMQQMQMYNPNQQVGVSVQSNSNMFFKTRLCNKWRQGLCPFGDKCTYAHGQHELRRVAPEVLMQQQMFAGSGQGMPGMQSLPGMPGLAGVPGVPGIQGHQDRGRYGKRASGVAGTGGDGGEKSQLYYKTRLCIRFMQSGYCVKGNECTFAHGYEDLRLMRKSNEKDDDVGGGAAGAGNKALGDGQAEEKVLNGDDNKNTGREDDVPLTGEQERARKATAAIASGEAVGAGKDGADNKEAMERKSNPYADDADAIMEDRDGGVENVGKGQGELGEVAAITG